MDDYDEESKEYYQEYTSWRIDELLLNCILTDELYFDRRNYFYNNFIINSVRRN